ncbi:PP2C family serine/threonine-protein phosphatase [Pseudomonas sp. S1_E04]
MAETFEGYRYKTSHGRIAGRSHAKDNTPCQDYAAVRNHPEFGCIALADGAGSRSKSEYGAQTVVKTVNRLLAQKFDDLWAKTETDPAVAVQDVLSHCLIALQREAKKQQCTLNDLASTLLFVAHSKGRFLAGHLGDGFIAQLKDDGSIVALAHPDNGEYANTTVFVTDLSASSRMRLYKGESGHLSAFAIMSDGTAESLYLRSTKSPAQDGLKRLFDWNSSLTSGRMKKVIRLNLEQNFARKTSDDCSIAILGFAPVIGR